MSEREVYTKIPKKICSEKIRKPQQIVQKTLKLQGKWWFPASQIGVSGRGTLPDMSKPELFCVLSNQIRSPTVSFSSEAFCLVGQRVFGNVSWHQVRRSRPLIMQLDTLLETTCPYTLQDFSTEQIITLSVQCCWSKYGPRKKMFVEWCLTSGTRSSQTSA